MKKLKMRILAAVINTYSCAVAYFKQTETSEPDPVASEDFVMKGQGKFLFYYDSPSKDELVEVTEKLTSVSIIPNTLVTPTTPLIVIAQKEQDPSQDVEYTLKAVYDSGDKFPSDWCVSCAINRTTKIAFPTKLYVYSDGGVLKTRPFVVLCIDDNYTGIPFTYIITAPGGAALNINNVVSRAAINVPSTDCFFVKEVLDDITGAVPLTGTIIAGYSIDVVFLGITYTRTFDIEIVNNII